jgi:hypothetical protein
LIGFGILATVHAENACTGSTTAVTGYTVVGAASGVQMDGSPELTFEYLSNSTQEGLTTLALIHLGSLDLPHATACILKIAGVDDDNRDFHREVPFDAARSRGCAFSVPALGN